MRWKVSLYLVIAIAMAIYGQERIAHNDVIDIEISQMNTQEKVSNETLKPRTNENDVHNRDDEVENSGVEEPSNEHVDRSNEVTTIVSIHSDEDAIDDVIQTEHGLVRGYRLHGLTGIQSYLDIPYGKITGPFEAPVLPEPWESIHEVTQHEKRCPQLDDNHAYVGDLDCLTLSVFIPPNPDNASVLFHVYDSNFFQGSGDPIIYGPEHLSSRGVILVLPNYRVGVLGFLCLQNETAPGNAALKDLTLALNWTKNNIAAFGGNPSNIVVSGDGTAGALVGYLAISSQSKGFINKIITESGSLLSHWALDRNPVDTASDLEEKLTHVDRMLKTNVFEDTDLKVLVEMSQDIEFRPCIENGEERFLSETPWNLLQNQEIDIKFMMGSANHAGMHEALKQTDATISELNENLQNILPNDLVFEDDNEEKLNVGKRVKTHYFGVGDITLGQVEKLSLLYTDISYLVPMIRSARSLVQAGAEVYVYEFAYVGGLNREQISLGGNINGAARGDIVGYIFTQDGDLPTEGSPEERMVNIMTDLWVSFIDTGNPMAEDMTWNQLQKTDEDEEEWLVIGSETKLESGMHVDRVQLWTELYEEHFIDGSSASPFRPRPIYTFPFLLSPLLFARKCFN